MVHIINGYGKYYTQAGKKQYVTIIQHAPKGKITVTPIRKSMVKRLIRVSFNIIGIHYQEGINETSALIDAGDNACLLFSGLREDLQGLNIAIINETGAVYART